MDDDVVAAGAAIDRLYAALAAGDGEGARACCTADFVVWHCFDGVEQDLDATEAAWAELRTAFVDIRFADVRRSLAGAGRIVSQHLFVGTRPEGTRLAWAVCLLIRMRDGLIARMEEYIDREGAFALDAPPDATPGLPPAAG